MPFKSVPRLPLLEVGLGSLLAVIIVGAGVYLGLKAEQAQSVPVALQAALRAAWAVRAEVPVDTAALGFQGPPLLAILLVPLAQPPAGVSQAGFMPAALATLVWYFFNLSLLAVTVHWLAGAMEGQHSQPSSWHWWLRRLLPLLGLLGPLVASLSHGSTDVLFVFILAGLVLALVEERRFHAGLWLAGAMTLHIYAVLLLVLTIQRRDRLMTLGVVAGLMLCLVLLPSAVFGFQRTSRLNAGYLLYAQELLRSGQWVVTLPLVLITIWALGKGTSSSNLNLMGTLVALLLLVQPSAGFATSLWLLPAVAVLVVEAERGHRLGIVITVTAIVTVLSLLVDNTISRILIAMLPIVLWAVQTNQLLAHSKKTRSVDEVTVPLSRAA